MAIVWIAVFAVPEIAAIERKDPAAVRLYILAFRILP